MGLLDRREHRPHERGVVNRMLDNEEGGLHGLATDLAGTGPPPAGDVGLEPARVGGVRPGHRDALGGIHLPSRTEPFAYGLVRLATSLELAARPEPEARSGAQPPE